jgi:hypothetical protein
MNMFRRFSRLLSTLVVFTYLNTIVTSTLVSAAPPPGPPFATVQDEIAYHRAQAADAQNFFSNTVSGGSVIPPYQGGGNFDFKKYDAATQTWVDDSSSVDLIDQYGNPITADETNAQVDELRGISNNPGAINVKAAEMTAPGASDAYDSSLESYARNPVRPNLYNDPYVQLSKQIMTDVSTNGASTLCTSTVTTESTTTETHVPIYRTCEQFAAPPSCTLQRIPTSIVIDHKSCEPGDASLITHIGSSVRGGDGITRIEAICGGGPTTQPIRATGAGECGGTQISGMITTSSDGIWRKALDYGICERDYSGGHKEDFWAPIDLWYRNFNCSEMPSDGTSPWNCDIELATTPSGGTVLDPHPANLYRVAKLIKQHNIYRLNESFVDQPPGCATSDRCSAQPDPHYTPSTSTREDQTSDEYFQCTDAAIRTMSSVPIDPTDDTLEGIYLPTRIDGPQLLFAGGNESIPCYSAVARNYDCNISLDPDDDHNTDLSPDAVDACSILSSDTSCSHVSTTPLVTDSSGIVLLSELVYDCGFNANELSLDTSRNVVCDTDIRCIGEECLETWDENNERFNEAAGQASTVGGAQGDSNCTSGDPNECRIFIGMQMECQNSSSVGGSDCCNSGGGMSFTDFMLAYKLSRTLNEQFDLTSKLVTNMPGYDKVVGNWDAMMNGVSAAGAYAKSSMVSAINWVSKPFMAGTETVMVETVSTFSTAGMPEAALRGMSATPTLATQLTADLLNSSYNMINSLSPGLAEALFMDGAATELSNELVDAGAEHVLEDNIVAAFNVVMWAYMAYQVYMLAISLIYGCDDNDPIMEQRMTALSCAGIGTERDGGLGLTKTTYACCFQTPLARIVQESAEQQGVRPPFGSGESRNCAGLSLTELQNLDWDLVELDDWINMLSATKQIPDSKEMADRFFGMDNFTRGTLVTDDDLTVEQQRREGLRQKANENLATYQANVTRLDQEIIALQNDIAFLENKLLQLLAQVPPNEAMINATQTELDQKRSLLQTAQTNHAHNLTKIDETNAQLATVTDVDIQFNRTTAVSRMDGRLAGNYYSQDGTGTTTVEEYRNNERAEIWKLANVPPVYEPPPDDDDDENCSVQPPFYYHLPGNITTYMLIDQPVGLHEFTLTITDTFGVQSSETQGSKTTTPTDTTITLEWAPPTTRVDGTPLPIEEIDHYSITHTYTPDQSLCTPPPTTPP